MSQNFELMMQLQQAAKEARQERQMGKCPKGHPGLEYVEGDFPTGVESLGYKEYTHEKGYYCEKCDHVYDQEDIEEV